MWLSLVERYVRDVEAAGARNKQKGSPKGAFFVFLQCFAVCHDLGDDLDHLVIAAAAASGAFGDIFYVLKHIEQRVHVGMVMHGVQDIEITDVIALTDNIILFRSGINGLQRADKRTLNLGHPKELCASLL